MDENANVHWIVDVDVDRKLTLIWHIDRIHVRIQVRIQVRAQGGILGADVVDPVVVAGRQRQATSEGKQ